MKALTFRGKETVLYETVRDPSIESPGDVIVRVGMAGICGSDLHPYHERERGLDRGTVMGHEFVGEVVDSGTGVDHHAVGDRVCSPFTTCCGDCFYCSRGLTCRCIRGQLFGWVEGGRGLHGAQAEYVRVPLADSTLVGLPDDVLAEEGLLVGDILATGFFCADQAGIEPDGTYAVVGCGPVGLMTIVGALERGAERLYALDPVPERREAARRFGARPREPGDSAAIEEIRAATDGRGVDAVMEAVGTPGAKGLAMGLLRAGGTLSSVGVHTDPDFGFTPVDAYDRNLTFKVGRCPARHYMERLLPVVQAKKYDLASVFSHHLPLSEGARGYEIFDKKLDGCTKVALTIP